MLMQEMKTTTPPKMERILCETVWNMYVREDRISEVPNIFPGHFDQEELAEFGIKESDDTVSESSS